MRVEGLGCTVSDKVLSSTLQVARENDSPATADLAFRVQGSGFGGEGMRSRFLGVGV